jgi:hypothetical protein
MSLISRLILGLAVTAPLALAPALAANAPPVAAPARPAVEVSPLPPVGDTATPIAPAPAPASPPAPAAPEPAWWQQPTFWALIALVETVGAFIATIAYMRKPERNRVLALAMTGGSAVFIVVALIAWLL